MALASLIRAPGEDIPALDLWLTDGGPATPANSNLVMRHGKFTVRNYLYFLVDG